MLGPAACNMLLFDRGNGVCTAGILGYTAGEGVLRELNGVGPEGRGLAGGDELVGSGHGVMDDRCKLNEQVIGELVHLGPIRDIGPEDELLVLVCLAVAVIDAIIVNILIEMIGLALILVIDIGRSSDYAAVSCGRRDAESIHKANACKLTVTGLAAVAIREITGRMAEGEAVIGRGIACAEAGTAEAGLNDSACFEQIRDRAYLCQLKIYGN